MNKELCIKAGKLNNSILRCTVKKKNIKLLDKQCIMILKCLPGTLFTPRVCSLVQYVIQIHPEKRKVQNVDSSQLSSEVNLMEKFRKFKVVERSSSACNKTNFVSFPDPGDCSYSLL